MIFHGLSLYIVYINFMSGAEQFDIHTTRWYIYLCRYHARNWGYYMYYTTHSFGV